ncbi:MAG: hypothetical protein HOV68_27145 [Streptomycetaceae bacterium]|nr:hypothetical protein [Streptomycetaceae bacterium]
MKRARSAAVVLALALAVSGGTGGSGARAEGAATRTHGIDPALLAHAMRVAPLNDVAQALGEQGRGDFADVYGNLVVDEPARSVTLYATDTARAARLVAAAKAAHRGIDTSLVKVAPAAYTKRALHEQAEKIVAAAGTTSDGPAVYSAAVNPDASGVTVTAKQSAIGALPRSLAERGVTGSVPVTYLPGSPVRPTTWRWNDGRPQIGGDVLIGPISGGKVGQCTSGIAAENPAGRDYLITAAHCYSQGTRVTGEGGPTPGKWTFTAGNEIGRISHVAGQWDAEAVDTGLSDGKGSKSAAADQPEGRWYPVTSTGFSYNGQSVCHNGARSYYDGRGVPCGITVDSDDVTYQLKWHDGTWVTVRGVHGTASAYGCTNGDSGALVFTLTGADARQARGIVSARQNTRDLFWTEAPDILKAFGMQLNPHT